MRYAHFEALAPLCPRCLHLRGVSARLILAERTEERASDLWQGRLCCSAPECQMEFPVIDGVPLIVADPRATLQNLAWQVMRRDDLAPGLASLLGDAFGPGGDYDTMRQHQSLYGESHYGDWAGVGPSVGAVAVVAGALAGLEGLPDGPAFDLGCGPGRTSFELARTTGRMVLGVDLSLTFLRMAQRLRLEGRISFPRRRVGVVYDYVAAELPAAYAGAEVDFWALDVQALPFASELCGLVAMVNVVDCVPNPTALVTEAARVAAPGAGGLVTTPFDWSQVATPIDGWFGGHSQRAPHQGAAEPVLAATLAEAGWDQIAVRDDLDWQLRLHARAEMRYQLHMALLRRRAV